MPMEQGLQEEGSARAIMTTEGPFHRRYHKFLSPEPRTLQEQSRHKAVGCLKAGLWSKLTAG